MTKRAPTTPIESGKPTLRSHGGPAGGLPAIGAALGYAKEQAGLLRSARTLLRVNQTEGFDCPSCAWPDPESRAMAEFCENGAKAVADEATARRVTPGFFERWSVDELTAQSDRWLNAQGRLTQPMHLAPGASHYAPISWEAAFELCATELRRLEDPNRAVFYTSGRTSNEAAFLYQLFVRLFGTNNLPDCSNMCHESSGTGLTEVLGTGKGTVQLEDFALADAIFVIGQNPGTNHPRMLSTLREAKQRGAAIVAINPLREAGLLSFQHPQKPLDLLGPGVPLADQLLQVRVGGDIALLNGLAKAVLEVDAARGGVVDRMFIARHTSGFEELERYLRDLPWELVVQESGVERAAIERAASVVAAAKRLICCWAMGITQHRRGVENVQTIVNLLLLGGHLGRPGAGACPVRGHSNVQGDRTMGIWEKLPPWADRLGARFGFEPPSAPGFDTVGAIEAMRDGRAAVFFGLGGNFVSATPDTELTAMALRQCRLTVHVSTKLNRSHLVTGAQALILPCLGRTERDRTACGEQFVTVEDSMGVVHRSQGELPPAGAELRSEVAIVAGVARAVLRQGSHVDWEGLAEDYDRIRDAIAQVVPGFEDYNRRVRERTGFVLPNAAREREFSTASGRAEFRVALVEPLILEPDELLMTTIRAHDQFNTTVYTHDDRYRGVLRHRRVVFMHPEDMAARGLGQGDSVDLTSVFEGRTRRAESFSVVRYELPRGCVATYFPEANALVPLESYAAKSRTPSSKAVAIRIERRS